MIKLKELTGLPSLQYHVENKLSLHENIYRYSSEAFINLFAEARQAVTEGNILLNEQDRELLETTDIGLYGEYEGKKVPLDLPTEYEDPYQSVLEDITIFGPTYEAVNIEDSYKDVKVTNDGVSTVFTFKDKHGIQRQLKYFQGGSIKIYWTDPKTGKLSIEDIPRGYEDTKVMNTFGKIMTKVIIPKFGFFTFIAADQIRYRLFRALIYNNIDRQAYVMDFDDEEKQITVNKLAELNEAEYRGKDVQLNKPKRGGPKKFYVYTKNKKGNVVKVNFGGTTGLNVKIDEPGARASFAARHQCDKKKDKTKPGYWACNIGRYWKSLGGSRNFSGYW